MNDGTLEDGPTLLEFPCEFPLKIVGLTRDDFAQSILEIVLRHAPDFDASAMGMRSSSKGGKMRKGDAFRALNSFNEIFQTSFIEQNQTT